MTEVKDVVFRLRDYAMRFRAANGEHTSGTLLADEAASILESMTIRVEGLEGVPCCPVCAVAFMAEDWCLTDIELGTCHAECLKDAPMVDLDTGEPLPEGAPAPAPFRHSEAIEAAESRATAAEGRVALLEEEREELRKTIADFKRQVDEDIQELRQARARLAKGGQ